MTDSNPLERTEVKIGELIINASKSNPANKVVTTASEGLDYMKTIMFLIKVFRKFKENFLLPQLRNTPTSPQAPVLVLIPQYRRILTPTVFFSVVSRYFVPAVA